jgi:hypothetical protein
VPSRGTRFRGAGTRRARDLGPDARRAMARRLTGQGVSFAACFASPHLLGPQGEAVGTQSQVAVRPAFLLPPGHSGMSGSDAGPGSFTTQTAGVCQANEHCSALEVVPALKGIQKSLRNPSRKFGGGPGAALVAPARGRESAAEMRLWPTWPTGRLISRRRRMHWQKAVTARGEADEKA